MKFLASALFILVFALGCSDEATQKETPYDVAVTVQGALTWDPGKKAFSVDMGKADGVIDLVAGNTEGLAVHLLGSLVVDKVARLKTRIQNLPDPVDEMVDVKVTVEKVDGAPGAKTDDPWSYGTIQDGQLSDAVQWRISGLDPTKGFTIRFKVTWTRQNKPTGPKELVVTGDYANAYYLVSPEEKIELAKIDPFAGGTKQPVNDVTLGFQGKRVYFSSKAPGVAGYDIYATDTMTGKNTVKLTSLSKKTVENLDANPHDARLVFEADVDSKLRIFTLDGESGTPVQISGDETMVVPLADDPTVSWGDREPAWSPDGAMIAYRRSSKDTKGTKIPMVNTVVVMNADGSGKVPVYASTDAGSLVNICWTHDSAFLIFTVGSDQDKNKKVLAVHQRSGTVSDLTAAFNKDSNGPPANHWCSPSTMAIVYNPVNVNPDIYSATLIPSGNKLSLGKVEVMATGKHFREPDWAVHLRTSSVDTVGTYTDKLPDQIIATADYASRYYLVDPKTGKELLSVAPGVSGLSDITLGRQGKRAYFASKAAGAKGPDLYGCDLMTGDNLKKLTSFNINALGDVDASPVSAALVFQAVKSGGITSIYTLANETAPPVKISGGESLTVPVADDPTVSWNDIAPAWSPDGKKIVYSRASKDTTGSKVPLISAVVVMDADGSNKTALWGVAGGGPTNPCWSHDGKFVIFTHGQLYARDKKVIAVNVATKTVSDLTASFKSHALGVPASFWCSPAGAALVYAPIEVNPDLYQATYSAVGDKITVGTITKLTADRKHYRKPDWATLTGK